MLSVFILSFAFSKAYTVFSLLPTCFYRLLFGKIFVPDLSLLYKNIGSQKDHIFFSTRYFADH